MCSQSTGICDKFIEAFILIGLFCVWNQQKVTWSIEIERQICFAISIDALTHWLSSPRRVITSGKIVLFLFERMPVHGTKPERKKLSHVFIVILRITTCAGRFVFSFLFSCRLVVIGVALFAFYAQKHFISSQRIAHACFGLSLALAAAATIHSIVALNGMLIMFLRNRWENCIWRRVACFFVFRFLRHLDHHQPSVISHSSEWFWTQIDLSFFMLSHLVEN